MTDTVATPPAAPTVDPAAAPAAAPAVTTTAPASAAATPPADPAPAATPEPAAPKGAPESYAAFKVPDGAQMNDAGLQAFGEFARELDLTQDAAQTMLDKLAPAMAKRQAEQLTELKAQWNATLAKDAELGKPENRAIAKTALDKFGTPELQQFLTDSGLIDHPELVRAFYNAGKAISPDTVVVGRQTQAAGPSAAQRLFPNMNP